ncbi:jg4474 [Pararge aegeria aegeria]|uniref:Jg4474 protein n=1 Tax=Pararge aegeria aegeria TaxID=348720 RepID=A0A8S4SNL2_9NEOP|nr:jg4474 [Pararge aegeria aegeria]
MDGWMDAWMDGCMDGWMHWHREGFKLYTPLELKPVRYDLAIVFCDKLGSFYVEKEMNLLRWVAFGKLRDIFSLKNPRLAQSHAAVDGDLCWKYFYVISTELRRFVEELELPT